MLQKFKKKFVKIKEFLIPTKKADNCCHSFVWNTIEPTKIEPILKPSTPIQKPSRQPTINATRTAAPGLGSDLECFVNDASISVECEELINQVHENS